MGRTILELLVVLGIAAVFFPLVALPEELFDFSSNFFSKVKTWISKSLIRAKSDRRILSIERFISPIWNSIVSSNKHNCSISTPNLTNWIDNCMTMSFLEQIHKINNSYLNPSLIKILSDIYFSKEEVEHRRVTGDFFSTEGYESFIRYVDSISEYDLLDKDRSMKCMQLLSIIIWKISKGLYKFDKDLFEEIERMPMPSKVNPDDIFKIPEYCVCINFRNDYWCLVFKCSGYNGCEDVYWLNCAACLGDKTFSFSFQTPMHNSKLYDEFENLEYTDVNPETKCKRDILNALIFINSQPKEIRGPSPYQYPHKIIHGEKILKPEKRERIFVVGRNIGDKIRTHRKLLQEHNSREGVKVCPHLRRAHWHGFWTKQDGQRKLIQKWLPPIFVNPYET